MNETTQGFRYVVSCGTDVGDLALTVPEQGRDLLVQPGEPEALTEVLRTLLADQARREGLAEAGLRRARETYSLQAMLKAYRKTYSNAMDKAAQVTLPRG